MDPVGILVIFHHVPAGDSKFDGVKEHRQQVGYVAWIGGDCVEVGVVKEIKTGHALVCNSLAFKLVNEVREDAAVKFGR